jgi:uncharacterized protein YggE
MTDTSNTPQPSTSVAFTVQDLTNLRSIIDLAASRGAFRANEMGAVGTVFNKLDEFLNSVNSAGDANPTAGTE